MVSWNDVQKAKANLASEVIDSSLVQDCGVVLHPASL